MCQGGTNLREKLAQLLHEAPRFYTGFVNEYGIFTSTYRNGTTVCLRNVKFVDGTPVDTEDPHLWVEVPSNYPDIYPQGLRLLFRAGIKGYGKRGERNFTLCDMQDVQLISDSEIFNDQEQAELYAGALYKEMKNAEARDALFLYNAAWTTDKNNTWKKLKETISKKGDLVKLTTFPGCEFSEC